MATEKPHGGQGNNQRLCLKSVSQLHQGKLINKFKLWPLFRGHYTASWRLRSNLEAVFGNSKPINLGIDIHHPLSLDISSLVFFSRSQRSRIYLEAIFEISDLNNLGIDIHHTLNIYFNFGLHLEVIIRPHGAILRLLLLSVTQVTQELLYIMPLINISILASISRQKRPINGLREIKKQF